MFEPLEMLMSAVVGPVMLLLERIERFRDVNVVVMDEFFHRVERVDVLRARSRKPLARHIWKEKN